MELNVFWTQFAKDKLDDIFEYYKLKASAKIAKKLVVSIVNHTIGLEKQPYIGQMEELLHDRQQNFRYVVYKNYR